VNADAVDRYFSDFVKLRRVTVDLSSISAQFDSRLRDFYKSIKPLMCWIIANRRTGARVVLSELKLDKLLTYDGSRTQRVRTGNPLTYLADTTHCPASPESWRQTHRVCRELGRHDPKRFVRGKFEAWFFIEFVKRAISDISNVAEEVGGSVSISTPLHESNFIQVLVRSISVPAPLDSFLRFHLQPTDNSTTSQSLRPWQKIGVALRNLASSFFRSI
jgi:hypothetical protein